MSRNITEKTERQRRPNEFSFAVHAHDMYVLKHEDGIWTRILYQVGLVRLINVVMQNKFAVLVNNAQVYKTYRFNPANLTRPTGTRIPEEEFGQLSWTDVKIPQMFVTIKTNTFDPKQTTWTYGFASKSQQTHGIAPYGVMANQLNFWIEELLQDYFPED